MMNFKRRTAALMLLGVFTLTADANSWDKLLEASQKSKLKAELLNFQLFPVDASISSGYGMRKHPIKGKELLHHGIDFAAAENAPFTAVADGRVITASTSPTFGNYIEVKHRKGIVTRYAHANDLHVKKGQMVKKGDILGLVGKTGLVTGAHLHFEVRFADGKAIDPEQYFLARQNMTVEQYIASTAPIPATRIEVNPTKLYDQGLTENQLAKIAQIQPITPPAPSINEHVAIEQTTLAMNVSQPVPETILNTVPVLEVKAESAKRTPFLTNQSMWRLASDIKSDIGYTGHLKDIIRLVVELNPDAFKDGNADFRYAHKPLYLPGLSELENGLSKSIQSNRPVWAIAQDIKEDYSVPVSIYQVLYAFVNKNEEAFLEGNIHRRLAGVPLRIPTEEEVFLFSRAEAYTAYKSSLSLLSTDNLLSYNQVFTFKYGV
jgi:FimV-like protein